MNFKNISLNLTIEKWDTSADSFSISESHYLSYNSCTSSPVSSVGRQTSVALEAITVEYVEDGSGSQFAVWGNNVYVVWEGPNGVMFAKSSVNGTSFADPLALGKGDSNSSVGMYPSVAGRGNNVYVIFSSGFDVFLLRSGPSRDCNL